MTVDRREPLAHRIAAVLPYVLPVLGGTIGIFYVNATPNASPVLWIASGALLGGLVARFLVKPLETLAAKQRLEAKTEHGAE